MQIVTLLPMDNYNPIYYVACLAEVFKDAEQVHLKAIILKLRYFSQA